MVRVSNDRLGLRETREKNHKNALEEESDLGRFMRSHRFKKGSGLCERTGVIGQGLTLHPKELREGP